MSKGCHFDQFVILPCVRCSLASGLSLRVLAETAECGINVCPAIRLHQLLLYGGEGRISFDIPRSLRHGAADS